MTRRASLVFLAVGSPLLVVALLVGGRWGEVVLALSAGAFPVALIGLGAVRRGPLGSLGWSLAALLAILEACLLGMMGLAGRVGEAPWVGGLPLAAALQVFGLFLLPLPLVALAYALTFQRLGLGDEDLERLRRGGRG